VVDLIRTMVETTIEIRFAEEVTASVESNVMGDAEHQAELVSFAHYAASALTRLGREPALALASSLARLAEEEAVQGAVQGDRGHPHEARIDVMARFLDTRGGPRMSFRVKRSGSAAGEDGAVYDSVQVLLSSLLRRRETDRQYTGALLDSARLIGRAAADGGIVPGGEFDVALAAADVAWRKGSRGVSTATPAWGEPLCPGCGNGVSFEARLWPSERSALRRCLRCGAGVWLRARRRPRLMPARVWQAMEDIRAELGNTDVQSAVPDSANDGSADGTELLRELKRVFAENRWPFTEVRGAPVILSELSGALGSWKFYAQAVEEQQLILLYSVCPLRVPEERRLEASSFLTRANYGLTAGNFELDFDDGEIRYKTVLQLSGDTLDAGTLKRIVRANGIAMETYLPGIGAVITGTAAVPALERREPS
jgi:hypothetical protein